MKRSGPKRDLSHQNEGFITSEKIDPLQIVRLRKKITEYTKVKDKYEITHTDTLEKMFRLLDKGKT